MPIFTGILAGVGFIIAFAYIADTFTPVRRVYMSLEKRLGNGMFYLPIIIFTFAAMFVSIPYTYSDGVKTGSITKFTKKGLFFKTWEGQLNLGGMVSNGDGGMVANVWNFSVQDETIAKQLQQAQGRISLKYDQKLLVPITQGSTNYIITGIKDTP